jgi:hypothetical protein
LPPLWAGPDWRRCYRSGAELSKCSPGRRRRWGLLVLGDDLGGADCWGSEGDRDGAGEALFAAKALARPEAAAGRRRLLSWRGQRSERSSTRRVFDEVHPDGPTPGVPTSALPAYSWLPAPACPRWGLALNALAITLRPQSRAWPARTGCLTECPCGTSSPCLIAWSVIFDR